MSSYYHVKTSLNSRNYSIIVVFSSSGVSLVTFTSLGASLVPRSTSSSLEAFTCYDIANPFSMLIPSVYNDVSYLLAPTCSYVGTLTFVLPRRKLIIFFCQFCLMRVVFSQDLPNSWWYTPATFNCNTIVEIQKAWPPIVISKFRISPVYRTELVFPCAARMGTTPIPKFPMCQMFFC